MYDTSSIAISRAGVLEQECLDLERYFDVGNLP